MIIRSMAVVALAAAAIAACGTDEPTAAPPDLPDHRGRFVVDCAHSHVGPDDPIVHPDEPGASHLHEFFGNADTGAASDALALVDSATTCESKADRAAYWVPTLIGADANRIVPERIDAYYRAGAGVDPAEVVPYPFGLQLLAGDPGSDDQPTSIVGWSCSTNPARSAAPPDCEGDLRLRLTFPDCWDGERLVAPDQRSHATYSGVDGCPASHPVAVPQLEVVVHYPVSGDPDGLRLSSGPVSSAHGDFWNLWEPDALDREVRACLNHDVVCGIAPA